MPKTTSELLLEAEAERVRIAGNIANTYTVLAAHNASLPLDPADRDSDHLAAVADTVAPTLEPSKNVTAKTTDVTVTYDSSLYEGMSQVIVKGVTAAIDENIISSNIKKDKSILGVPGALVPLEMDSESDAQYFGADSDGLYLSTVAADEHSFTLGLDGTRLYVQSSV